MLLLLLIASYALPPFASSLASFLQYNVWASTDSGNRRLDEAFRESSAKGPIYLFFSVNASGQFCGMAQMLSPLDYSTKCELWAQDKWNGQFQLKWIFLKDIPNNLFRHIRLEYVVTPTLPQRWRTRAAKQQYSALPRFLVPRSISLFALTLTHAPPGTTTISL